jgi:hypothetical protein
MKLIFIPLFVVLYLTNCYGQKTIKRFPESFIGNWSGTMKWYPNNGKPPTNVPTQLIIQPIKDSANQYNWQIVYGTKKEDVRPYTLRKVDTVHNHWVIDEHNGIVIDCYWLGNKLISAFAVQGNVVQSTYWLQHNELHFEFISYAQKASSITGKGTEESPMVDLMKIKSYQKGIMTKLK